MRLQGVGRDILRNSGECGGPVQGQGSENFLYKVLMQVYGRYDTENGRYPCLLDLADYLHTLRMNNKIPRGSDEYHWFTRVLNRVESYAEALGRNRGVLQGVRAAGDTGRGTSCLI